MRDLEALAVALRLSDAPIEPRTICEVLRELGRSAWARGDVTSLQKILEATHMAKRMQRKLDLYAERRQNDAQDHNPG